MTMCVMEKYTDLRRAMERTCESTNGIVSSQFSD